MQFDEFFYFYIISRSCETKEEKVSRFSVTTMIVERTNGSSINSFNKFREKEALITRRGRPTPTQIINIYGVVFVALANCAIHTPETRRFSFFQVFTAARFPRFRPLPARRTC